MHLKQYFCEQGLEEVYNYRFYLILLYGDNVISSTPEHPNLSYNRPVVYVFRKLMQVYGLFKDGLFLFKYK